MSLVAGNQEIVYLGDLVKKTERELLEVPNLGKNSLADLKRKLVRRKLDFGMPITYWNPAFIEKAQKLLSAELKQASEKNTREMVFTSYCGVISLPKSES